MFNTREKIIIQRHRPKFGPKSSKFKSSLIPTGSYLREFSSITSLHGFMYLGEPKRPLLERIFWCGVMSLVITLCGLQIYLLFNNWLSSRTILTLDNNKYNIWDLPFPAITFCSDIQLQNISNKSLKDGAFNKEFEDAINLLCKEFDFDRDTALKYINPNNWQYLIKNHKIMCTEIVSTLVWLYDEIKSPCDFIQPIITSFGLCYSINMVPFRHLFNDNYLQIVSSFNHTQADIIDKNNETIWTPETGYNRNSTSFDVPWRVTGDTIENAVRVFFALNNKNFENHCPKSDSGLTLIIHNPAEVPIGIQPTAYVRGNTMLSISLSITLLRISPKIKTWEPNLRNCYFQHEKKLKFFKLYTLHNCEIECRANTTYNQCGCNAYYQPRDPEVPVCGTSKLDCIRESSTIGYSIFDKEIKTSSNMESCKCLPNCMDIRYQHNTVEFFRNWTSNSTVKKRKFTDGTAVVIMYFNRKTVIDVKKAPLMPFNELLGNIGGLFGLFIGCSIVSFFEIIYFFVIRFYFDRRNQNKAKSKSNNAITRIQ